MILEIGIDLGTTNTVVSFLKNGALEQLRFRNKDNLPSTMLFVDQKVTIGDIAKRKSALYPNNYIKSSKTFMGDTSKSWEIEGKIFTPTNVAIEILKEINKNIKKTDPSISEVRAVITVPAYFTSTQIDETKKAGEAAGFIIERIITEPVAAAIAYGIDDQVDQTLFIIDIGGGTFDTSILEVKGSNFNTLAIDGDSKLGGDDFDNHILEAILKFIRKDQGVNLSSYDKSDLNEDEYRKAYQAIINKAEDVKIELSEFESVSIEIANLFSGYNLSMSMTRDEFEQISSISIEKIKRTIQKTMTDNDFSPEDIDKVVLVGGSSKIPVVREFVTELFNTQPYSDKPLDKLVAMGAAIIAHQSDTVQSKIEINDIISHSLGIEIVDDRFSPILEKNSKYPVSKSQMYTTVSDFQQHLDVNVFEGEDENDVTKNSFYGGFTLSDIEQAYAGSPQIEVTFEFDINRILKVTARDLNTNSKHSEVIDIDKTQKKNITPEVQPFDIALVIDVSYSMNGYPLQKAKEACQSMVADMIDLNVHRIGLVEFESHASTLSYLTQDKHKLDKAISSLHCKGGTDIRDGLRVAEEELFKTREKINKELVILVTDGDSPEAPAIRQAEKIKQLGMRIVSIGVGHGVNERLLRNIATSDDYYQIDTVDKLQEIFHHISCSLQTI
jgi:molecular chaperone DnaK